MINSLVDIKTNSWHMRSIGQPIVWIGIFADRNVEQVLNATLFKITRLSKHSPIKTGHKNLIFQLRPFHYYLGSKEMNTDYTSADMTSASKKSHTNTSNKEVRPLIVVSILWLLAIGTLGYIATEMEDIRVGLLLAIVLMMGIPLIGCTYITNRKEKTNE